MIKKGFTLIENITMLFIISVVTLALLQINLQNTKINMKSSDNYQMYLIATSLCEIFKSQSNNLNDMEVILYLNDDDEIKNTIEENIDKYRQNQHKKYNIYIKFETIENGLNRMSVKVFDENKNSIILNCYK